MEADRLAQAIEDLARTVEENTTELQAVREAIGDLRDFGELKAVRDAIDDLRVEYEHAFRNGTCPYLAEAWAARRSLSSFPSDAAVEMTPPPEQTQEATAEGATTTAGLHPAAENRRADEVPETIACAYCDVASPESVAAALQEGWTELQRDDGAAWNYLAICPQCQAELAEEEEEPQEKAEVQRTLL